MSKYDERAFFKEDYSQSLGLFEMRMSVKNDALTLLSATKRAREVFSTESNLHQYF